LQSRTATITGEVPNRPYCVDFMAIVFDEPLLRPFPLAVPAASPPEKVTFVFPGACAAMSALDISWLLG